MTTFETTIVCLLAAVTAALILVSMRYEKSRFVSLLMTAMSVNFMICYVGFSIGRGGPKSALTETDRPAEAEVLWMLPVKGGGTYAVLTWPGLAQPKYFFFKWDPKRGAASKTAVLEAAARRSGLLMENPFGGDEKTPDGGSSGDNATDNAGVPGFSFPARPVADKPDKS